MPIVDLYMVLLMKCSFYCRNVSQNASKEKHRSSIAGIAGCVTPGGDFFIPNKGRSLLGCEKLLIQGLPYFRLALGNESEVQLGDLGGNAMSLTVVSACMLAAITCQQLQKEFGKKFNVVRCLKFDRKQAREVNQFFKEVEPILMKKAPLKNLSKQNIQGNHTDIEDESLISRSCPALEVFKRLANISDEAIVVSAYHHFQSLLILFLLSPIFLTLDDCLP